MRRRIQVGRALGVDIAVDWSFVLTFALLAWTLFSVGSRVLPHLDLMGMAAAAVGAALGIFVVLALHEIVHGVVLRLWGVPVRRLTLFLVGGITDAERHPASVRSELIAATIAPLSTIALGVALVLAVAIADGPLPRDLGDIHRLGAPGVVVLGVAFASFAIGLLSAFPAYPLDGGRILRAIFWSFTKDIEKATRWAAWGGEVVGFSLVTLGVAIAFAGRGPGVALGMWLAFIGWFLASGAAQAYESVIGVDVLGDTNVRRLMKRSFVAIPADASLATAQRTWRARGGDNPLPVVDGSRLVGFLDPRSSAHDEALARDAATPALVVSPDEPVARRLADLVAHPRLAVVEGEMLVGVLDRDDVMQWIDARTPMAATTSPQDARRSA
jgi:Zn-dependent protease